MMNKVENVNENKGEMKIDNRVRTKPILCLNK